MGIYTLYGAGPILRCGGLEMSVWRRAVRTVRIRVQGHWHVHHLPRTPPDRATSLEVLPSSDLPAFLLNHHQGHYRRVMLLSFSTNREIPPQSARLITMRGLANHV